MYVHPQPFSSGNFMVLSVFFIGFTLACARCLHDQGWLFEPGSCVANKIFSRDPAEKLAWVLNLRFVGKRNKVVCSIWTSKLDFLRGHVEFRWTVRMFGAIDCVPHEWKLFVADCSSSLALFAAYDCMAWVDNSGRPWICWDDESI